MVDCNLQIHFDREEPEYEPGEQVTGTIVAEVNEDTTCNALEPSIYWRTHGRGSRNTGNTISLTPAAENEQWSAGETYEYPFSFEAPEGPFTYHGELVNVDWYLYTSADISWAIDPSFEREFLVKTGEVDEYNTGNREIDTSKEFKGQTTGGLIGKLLGGTFGLAFFVGPPALYVTVLDWQFPGMLPAFIALVFMLVGGLVFYGSIQNFLAKLKLGKVEATLSDVEVSPGEEISFGIAFSPDSELTINEIEFRVECEEWVSYQSGTDRRTSTRTVWENEMDPGKYKGKTLRPGETVQVAESMELPEEAPCSFAASCNKVRWNVHVQIDIPGWPDWQDQSEFIVSPAA